MADTNDMNEVDEKIQEIRRLIRGQLGLNKSKDQILTYLQEKGYPQYLIDQEIGGLQNEKAVKTRKSGLVFVVIGLLMCMVGIGFWGFESSTTMYYPYGLIIVGIPFFIMGLYKLIKGK